MEIILGQPYSFYQLGCRDNQEDARYPDSDCPRDPKPFFVVCDGVGGIDAGEVASKCVATSIGTYMQKFDPSQPFGRQEFRSLLEYAYRQLDRKMKDANTEMATTLTFVAFSSSGAFCAHIGDSRIYHIRPGVGILYQSDDHSLVNALVHSGNLTPEEAVNHPQSNIITRCMGYVPPGGSRSAATTLLIDDIEEGDYFFLCSDGVIHEIDNDNLVEILSLASISDREKMAAIAAKSRDSIDNNTAWLIPVYKVYDRRKEAELKESEGGSTVTIDRVRNVTTDVGVPPKENKIKKFFQDFFG